ncbi:hypothetical protein [Bacillus sp. T3]|uniref:rolling circle replication-associated protein n=1 Tax=Bacillus sp. T3 TaxID=467262 RepID=UPI002982B71D|nr:hypothetical protein [Bacillus sp. T3]
MASKFYNKKAIITGSHIEFYNHEKPISYGHTCKVKGGRKLGKSGITPRSKEYRDRRNKEARNDLIRLININFSGQNYDPIKFITLTFRDGSIPDLTDTKRANKELKKYLRKLRNHYNKLKYISVIEFQDENNRGAIHFHLIAKFPVVPVSREKAIEWINEGKLSNDYNIKNNHYEWWGNGSVTIKAIKEAKKYKETSTSISTSNIGQYVAAYMTKNLDDQRLQGVKAYSPSQGLKKPVVLYEEEAEKAIEGLEKENVVYANSYIDKYHNTQVNYTKFHSLKG